jgi:hypothetical protein
MADIANRILPSCSPNISDFGGIFGGLVVVELLHKIDIRIEMLGR